jgi:isopentenyl-diphosphate Delta-isomerase
MCRRGAPELPVLASGGIRDGIDVAKCIALGATVVGFAGDFLRAAVRDGAAGVVELAEILTGQLRVAMFCTGAANLNALAQTKLRQEWR